MGLQQPLLALLRIAVLLAIASAAATPMAAAAAGVTLMWDYTASGAAGFVVYCGTASESYSTSIDVGETTSYTISGLTAGVRYYCATTAYDAAKVESNYSAEVAFSIPTTPPPSPSPTPLPSSTGLVAAYAFNEGEGTTVADVSGNQNNGTISSGVTWTTAGRFGNALLFNGSTGLVTVPDSASLHLTTGMTLEAWVKASTVSSAWRDVIYKGNDTYYLEATSSTDGAGAATSAAAYEAVGAASLQGNTWTHLAGTYDNKTLRLYVNGVQVSSIANANPIASSTYPLQIGGDSIYGQYFQGTIDEVRVYNRALSQTEIQNDMNKPVAESLFTTQTPVFGDPTDGVPYEQGMKFKVARAGKIAAIRYWKAPSDSGTHVGRIWSGTGTLLASVTFTGESAAGWQQQALSTPLAVVANTTYMVSVNIASHYPDTYDVLATPIVNGDISSVADGNNGVFGDPFSFPTSSYRNSNYFRDVVFVPD